MTLEGTLVNGVIVLESGTQLPEGARVRVELQGGDKCGARKYERFYDPAEPMRKARPPPNASSKGPPNGN